MTYSYKKSNSSNEDTSSLMTCMTEIFFLKYWKLSVVFELINFYCSHDMAIDWNLIKMIIQFEV